MSKKYAMNLPVNERSIRCDKVALKRMGALGFDFFLISLMILTPMASSVLAVAQDVVRSCSVASDSYVFQYILTTNFAEKFKEAFAHDPVVGIALCLFFTPLPLIYWRLFFEVFMHTRTPGELLVGVGSFCKDTDVVEWANEIAHGLLQYFYLIGALSVATMSAGISFELLRTIIGTETWLLSLPFFLGLFGALYVCHRMQSEDIYGVDFLR